MIDSLSKLNEYITADRIANRMCRFYWLKLFYGNDNARAFRYLKCLRKLEYSINTNSILKHWYRFRERRLGLKYNIFIVPNTVGKGLYLPHLQGGGVIINCISMGRNCIVGPGVLVGNKHSQENRAIIGDNVELTTGCKVIGKIIIGNNSIVAPNSVVIKDVPANCIVGGIPAKVIKEL